MKNKKDNQTNWIIIIIAVIAFFFIIGFSGTGGMMSGFWGFGWLFMILIFVALVLFIVWLVKEIQKK